MKKSILSILFISLITISCNNNNTGDVDLTKDPIVSVFDQTLYKADIKGLFSPQMTPEDSTAILQSYINKWTEEQLIYKNALRNLSNEEEIQKLVDAYKKTLITNSYLTQLLEERISESVEDAELLSFFEKNKERFSLKENIIKGLYLKVPKESTQLQNFKRWYKDDSEESINNIDKQSLQNAVSYDNFYSRWISLDDVMENIPENISDRVSFLKNNKTLEVSDSLFVYLLNIKEYKLAGDEIPFEYIKDVLIKAYKEDQRADFIRNLTKDLHEKALLKGEIQYYNQNN